MAALPAPSGGGATPSSTNTTAASDLLELLRRLRSIGFLPDLAGDHHLSTAFERVLSLFFSEVLLQEPPTLPAALGEGPPLDLFLLYSASRRHPQNWARTASALSLRHPGAPSAVKLLYSKYLHPLHRWLCLVLDRPRDAQCDAAGQLLDRPTPPVRSEGKVCIFDDDDDDDDGDEDEKNKKIKKEEDVGVGCVKKSGESVKRKGVDLVGVLKWLKGVSKGPGKRGNVPEKVESVAEFKLAVLARKAILTQRTLKIALGTFPSQRGHPSMYDDLNGPFQHGDEKVRYSRRILNKNFCDGSEKSSKCEKSFRPDESFENSSREGSPQDPSPKRRAKVPPWSGHDANDKVDDSKWLGTLIWAPELKEDTVSTDQSSIGRGRQDFCFCELPGSVDCVRFHVAENRLRLKCQLDKAFYDWKFPQMGEEVSLSWSAEEEEKFKSIVRMEGAQSPDSYFWPELYKSFPSKSRQSLVSYYFNVFLLRRRSYQNRMTPMNIDSDDEEGEFGFLSNRLGDDAFRPRHSRKVVCHENTQAIDLEAYIDLDSDLEDS